MDTVRAWILVLVFVTGAGGVSTETIGAYASEDACAKAGTEAQTRLAADEVTVRHLCVRGE